MHALAPLLGLYFPVWQVEHSAAPVSEYSPDRQSVQAITPSPLDFPLGHDAHNAEEAPLA